MFTMSGCSTNKSIMSNKHNMTSSFLLTEIALDLLGNKFYDIYGNPVKDLQTLYSINTNTSSNERNLAAILGISDTSLNAADNIAAKEIISLDEDDAEEDPFPLLNSSGTPDLVAPTNFNQDEEMIPTSSSSEEEVIFTMTTEHVARKRLNKNKSPFKKAATPPKHKTYKSPPHQIETTSSLPQIVDNNNTKNYNSSNREERLECILNASSCEYIKMKKRAEKQKSLFLEQNKNLIQMRSLKEADFLKRLYSQQKSSLIEESTALMQFIKFIKNEDSHPRDILVSCADDILKAKDMIS